MDDRATTLALPGARAAQETMERACSRSGA